jgi:hypothetical protein
MSKRDKDKGRLAPFVPLDREMMMSDAWRATSFGARILYLHLKRRWSFKYKNNGHIHLSQRDAQKELGIGTRNSVTRWFRELQHYGFIVMTDPGGLGVDGKGRSPHWRLTEAEARGGRNGNTWMLPTKDYNKWNGVKFKEDGRRNNRFRKTESRTQRSSQGGPKDRARPGPKDQPLHGTSGPKDRAIGETTLDPKIESAGNVTPLRHQRRQRKAGTP